MWELDYKESWVPKNWCSWNVVLEKTLQSPLDSKESNQSFLKEISPEYSLEGLTLKLKLQYFGHLMWKANSLEKTLIVGKTEGRRRRGRRGWDGWMASLTQWTGVWASSGSWWWTGRPGILQSMGFQRVGHNWMTEFSSVAQSCSTLCDPMDCSTLGFPVYPQLPELVQTHVRWVSNAIQPSNPLSSPSPPALHLFQHQGLFQGVSSLHKVAKVLEFQLCISPSNEYSGLISFRMDWLHLLAVQGTLKSLLQHCSSKASIL